MIIINPADPTDRELFTWLRHLGYIDADGRAAELERYYDDTARALLKQVFGREGR